MTSRDAPAIVLASRSPRRRALLEQIGVRHRVLAVDVDESRLPGESPHSFVARLARLKATAGLRAAGAVALVIGADTAVVRDATVLGKPADGDDAVRMLRALSGGEHRVLSAVALAGPDTEAVRVNESRVRFRALAGDEIRRYVASGEPRDKAGAYAIQGAAAAFVSRLEGSFSGVMGLPLFETAELLREAGIDVLRSDTTDGMPPPGARGAP